MENTKNEETSERAKANEQIKSVLRCFLNKVIHVNKQYYYGRMIRWLLEDKNGKGVYCDRCGNIANGIEDGKVLGLTYRIPLCKKHLGYS